MTTDKRFNLAFYDEYDGTFSIQDKLYWKENKHLHSLDEIVDLLNKLEEENRQLKLELDTHKHPLWSTREAERIVNELKQENEQLKKILGFLRNDNATDILNVLNSQENQIMELKKENEQLKQDLEHCANQFKDDGKNVLLGLK